MQAQNTTQTPLDTDAIVKSSDPEAIRQLVRRSGVFSSTEIDIAAELADAVLDGTDTSYQFIFYRDIAGNPIAYSCYGEIPLTDKRFDLYWIVVDPACQGQGLAARLIEETSARIAALGGSLLYAETSGTEAYSPARKFYAKHGFAEAARFPHFYRENDDKIVFVKKIA